MILYTILDEENNIIRAEYAEELPENGIENLYIDNFIKPKFDRDNNVFYESADFQEVIDLKNNKAIEIDLYYTGLISDLLRKHTEKLLIEQVPIPIEVLAERDRLRQLCNNKIAELGITDFTYRTRIIEL